MQVADNLLWGYFSHETLDDWLQDLEDKGMILSKSEIKYAFDQNIHCNIFDPQTFVFRADLKRINTPLDRLTYKYRQQVHINNRAVWINCPESQISVKVSPGFRATTDLEDLHAIVETMEIHVTRLKEFVEVTDSYHYLCNLLNDFDTKASNQLKYKLGCTS